MGRPLIGGYGGITITDLRYEAGSTLAAATEVAATRATAARRRLFHDVALDLLPHHDLRYARLADAAGLAGLIGKCHPDARCPMPDARREARRGLRQTFRRGARAQSDSMLLNVAESLNEARCDEVTRAYLNALRADSHQRHRHRVEDACRLQASIEQLKRQFDANIREDEVSSRSIHGSAGRSTRPPCERLCRHGRHDVRRSRPAPHRHGRR